MGFINKKINSQGFTIVELLIVVVVIAILAAITIVSYNGITSRANASAAASLAASIAKKAELYNSDDSTSGYPKTVSALAGDNSKGYYLVANGQLAAPTPDIGKTTVQYIACGIASSGTGAPSTQAGISTVTGALINYWDFNNSRVTTTSTNPAGLTAGQTSGTVGGKTIGCPTTAS